MWSDDERERLLINMIRGRVGTDPRVLAAEDEDARAEAMADLEWECSCELDERAFDWKMGR